MNNLQEIKIHNNFLPVDSNIAQRVEKEMESIICAAKLLNYKITVVRDYGPEMSLVLFLNEWNNIQLIFEHDDDKISEISFEISLVPHSNTLKTYSSKDKNDLFYPFKKLMEVL